MKTAKRILAILLYSLLFAGLLAQASDLLMHKQIEGRWNMTAKVYGFFNLEPNTLDVVFFGSSHMYCSLDPNLLEEQTGLRSYIFATQQQPLWITYHYMVETLKTQAPEIMAVEVYMASQMVNYMDEGTNHTAIDPFPLSLNKIQMIRAAVPKGERRFYLFDIMKYHGRWEELENTDFDRTYEQETDPDKGYVRLSEVAKDVVYEDVSEITEARVGTGKSLEYIAKMIDLAEENGIRLVLFKAPSNATLDEKKFYNGVANLAKERGVEFIDYNSKAWYQELDLDLATDFYDQRHLNELGMKKFTTQFGQHLLTRL